MNRILFHLINVVYLYSTISFELYWYTRSHIGKYEFYLIYYFMESMICMNKIQIHFSAWKIHCPTSMLDAPIYWFILKIITSKMAWTSRCIIKFNNWINSFFFRNQFTPTDSIYAYLLCQWQTYLFALILHARQA